MESTRRLYEVGGIVFSVELCGPWRYMNYTAPVKARIDRYSGGMTVPTLPTRAGDYVPARTYVTSKVELPPDYDCHTLDFSQYEPFNTCPDRCDTAFRMTVAPAGLDDYSAVPSDSSAVLIRRINDDIPHFGIYRRGDRDIFLFTNEREETQAVLDIAVSGEDASFHTKPGMRPYSVMLHLNTALMIQYTYVSSAFSALLIHSSVIEHDGLANMFLGESGTGKSTHSRLWLENIPGTELVNDDNPVLRLEDGVLYVYGSPWSGKTPCYRNKKVPVRALVSLVQAPHNSITRLGGVEAFMKIYTSVSSIHWSDSIEEDITDTVSGAASAVPCWSLECLPDADAAATCVKAIENASPDK